MRIYGIFDGVARKDNLIVAAVPDYETWKIIKGPGSPNDYLDYLWEQEKWLQGFIGAARVVRVPLDIENYRDWLSRNTYWQDGPEARGAWALEVAGDSEKLAALTKKHPVLPRAPENAEDVDIYFAVLVFSLENISEGVNLGSQLEPARIQDVAQALEKDLPGITPYRRITNLRADGARAVIGDRLIVTTYIEDVQNVLSRIVPALEGNVASIPKKYRIKKSDLYEVNFPAFLAVLLPIALHGGTDMLEYCYDYIMEQGNRLGAFSKAVAETVGSMSSSRFSEVIPVVPFERVEGYLDELFNEIETDDGAKPDGAKPKHRLKRIK